MIYKTFWAPLLLCTLSQIALPAQSVEQQLQEVLNSIYEANPNSAGLIFHVEAPGHGISWSGAAGYSDASNKISIEADQPALIASSIKTYISATMLRLVEIGKLELDRPVS